MSVGMATGGLIEDFLFSLIGSPLIFGVIIFLIFFSMMIAVKVNYSAGVVCFVPVSFLVFEYIPMGKIIFGLLWGIIFGLALLKVMRR